MWVEVGWVAVGLEVVGWVAVGLGVAAGEAAVKVQQGLRQVLRRAPPLWTSGGETRG